MSKQTTNHYVPAISRTKPSFFKRFLPLFILLGSIVLLVVFANLRQPPPAEEKPPVAQLVETVTVSPESLTYSVDSQGTVEPRTETTLVPEVAGKIVSVSPVFVAGGFFQAGDVLMEIDPSDYQAALTSAEANLANAEAQLAEERARSEQARKDWESLKGPISSSSKQPSTLVLREPQLAQAEANIKAMRASLQMASRDMQRTKISLPYAGLVKERQVDLGQYVSLGTVLGITFAVDVAEVRLPLTENDLGYVQLPDTMHANDTQQATPVTLTTSGNRSSQSWNAHIVRTEGVVDAATRVIYAVAVVEDPYGLLGTERPMPLRMGTFVNARIQGVSAYDVIALPRASLREDGTILVADTDNKLDVRTVVIDRATPSNVYVRAGLEPGERVITTSIAAPIPGTPLRIYGEDNDQPDDTDELGQLAKDAAESASDLASDDQNSDSMASDLADDDVSAEPSAQQQANLEELNTDAAYSDSTSDSASEIISEAVN